MTGQHDVSLHEHTTLYWPTARQLWGLFRQMETEVSQGKPSYSRHPSKGAFCEFTINSRLVILRLETYFKRTKLLCVSAERYYSSKKGDKNATGEELQFSRIIISPFRMLFLPSVFEVRFRIQRCLKIDRLEMHASTTCTEGFTWCLPKATPTRTELGKIGNSLNEAISSVQTANFVI